MVISQSSSVAGFRSLLLAALVAAIGCDRGARESRPSEGTPPAPPPSAAPARSGAPAAAWPAGLSEKDMLLRLRAHYREASRASRVVLASATKESVRYEADWLLKIYDHVSEHFEVSLRDWYGPAAAAEPDPVLHEFTEPSTISDVSERERRFAEEVVRNHERLIAFVRTPEYERYAAQRPLLQEIRLDVETSQAAQVKTFQAAVLGSK
jgi:hypothetical protein